MPTVNYQQKLLEEVKIFIEPLVTASGSPESLNEFFRVLGWDLDQMSGTSVSDVQYKLGLISTAYSTFTTLIQTQVDSIPDLLIALDSVQTLVEKVQDLQSTTATGALDGFDEVGKDI